jgi:hypothetical protein
MNIRLSIAKQISFSLVWTTALIAADQSPTHSPKHAGIPTIIQNLTVTPIGELNDGVSTRYRIEATIRVANNPCQARYVGVQWQREIERHTIMLGVARQPGEQTDKNKCSLAYQPVFRKIVTEIDRQTDQYSGIEIRNVGKAGEIYQLDMDRIAH